MKKKVCSIMLATAVLLSSGSNVFAGNEISKDKMDTNAVLEVSLDSQGFPSSRTTVGQNIMTASCINLNSWVASDGSKYVTLNSNDSIAVEATKISSGDKAKVGLVYYTFEGVRTLAGSTSLNLNTVSIPSNDRSFTVRGDVPGKKLYAYIEKTGNNPVTATFTYFKTN